MFTEADVNLLHLDKFELSFVLPEKGIAEIKSKSTGHVWMIQIIGKKYHLYHKHLYKHPYHYHWMDRSAMGCVLEILNHDLYELNGRQPLARRTVK